MQISGNNVSNECGCFLDMEQHHLLQEALSSVNSIKQYWGATYAFPFLLSYLRILFLVTTLPLSKSQASSKSYKTQQVHGICGLNHLPWTHTCCQQVFHQFKMTLLSSFHQRCWATKLYVSSCLNKEVSDFREASTAGQGQGCFLCLFCLCVNICPWETNQPLLPCPHTAWGLNAHHPHSSLGVWALLSGHSSEQCQPHATSEPSAEDTCWPWITPCPAECSIATGSHLVPAARPPSLRGLPGQLPSEVCTPHHWPPPGWLLARSAAPPAPRARRRQPGWAGTRRSPRACSPGRRCPTAAAPPPRVRPASKGQPRGHTGFKSLDAVVASTATLGLKMILQSQGLFIYHGLIMTVMATLGPNQHLGFHLHLNQV